MKQTENRIQNKFLSLIKNKNIDDIDVSSLVKKLNITRQSFYYHYQSILDLVLSIYLDQGLLKVSLDTNKEKMIEESIDFIFKNEEFNHKVIESSTLDALKDILLTYFNDSLIVIFKNQKTNLSLIEDYSRFYSYALTNELIFEFNNLRLNKDNIFKNILKILNSTKLFND